MDRCALTREVASLERQVAKARAMIAMQSRAIARLKEEGRPTAFAEGILLEHQELQVIQTGDLARARLELAAFSQRTSELVV